MFPVPVRTLRLATSSQVMVLRGDRFQLFTQRISHICTAGAIVQGEFCGLNLQVRERRVHHLAQGRGSDQILVTNKNLVVQPRKADVVEIVCNQPMTRQDLEILVTHVSWCVRRYNPDRYACTISDHACACGTSHDYLGWKRSLFLIIEEQ